MKIKTNKISSSKVEFGEQRTRLIIYKMFVFAFIATNAQFNAIIAASKREPLSALPQERSRVASQSCTVCGLEITGFAMPKGFKFSYFKSTISCYTLPSIPYSMVSE